MSKFTLSERANASQRVGGRAMTGSPTQFVQRDPVPPPPPPPLPPPPARAIVAVNYVQQFPNASFDSVMVIFDEPSPTGMTRGVEYLIDGNPVEAVGCFCAFADDAIFLIFPTIGPISFDFTIPAPDSGITFDNGARSEGGTFALS